MDSVIILGSARNDGDTSKLTQELMAQTQWPLINLNDYDFGYYDYEHRNKDDDYLPLMRQIIGQHDTFVFATPVYWYSMSGIMKVFFDRFTDLLTIEKELGRQLRGKKMAVVSCSVGENLGAYFWLPFSKTAAYLGMEYLGNVHTVAGQDNTPHLNALIQLVEG